jgi:hypothetical protein
MNQQPFQTAAKEWIGQIEKQRKLSKLARRSVLSFAIWMDEMIRNQELKEEMEHGKEN